MYLAHKIATAVQSPAAVVAAGLVVASGIVASYWHLRHRPSAAETERLRREQLSLNGRIVDGSITETRWLTEGASALPQILMYRYSIAGVTYECGQDVRALGELVRYVRIDLPVQVRFNPRNPGDSIVVSESWSGLRMRGKQDEMIASPESGGSWEGWLQGRQESPGTGQEPF